MFLLNIPFIIPFLLFMGVLRAFDRQWFNWKVSALLVAAVPFALTYLLLPAVEYWVDPSRGFTVLPLTLYTLTAQFIVALILFRFLERLRDSSTVGWYVVAFLGALLLYMFIPAVIDLVL